MKKVVYIGSALLVAHLILRELRIKQPDIHYVDYIPGNFNAITLPPYGILILSEQSGNEALLKHELIHWQQYQRMGLLPYYYNYMRDYFKVGYDLHPMEQEARQNETKYVQMNYTESVRRGIARTIQNANFRKAS